MLDYNYANWALFIVKDITQIPEKEHYVVMESKTRSYKPHSGYEKDGDYEEDVKYEEIRYFAFLEEEKWKEMISEIYSVKPSSNPHRSESRFALFKQSGRIVPKINVSVSL